QPHGGKMPEQSAGQPAAQRDAGGKGEPEQRRGIVDLPPRADHDCKRQRIDPMGYPHVERMDDGVPWRRRIDAARAIDYWLCAAGEGHTGTYHTLRSRASI